MNLELALLEALGEVFPDGERFDPFDHSAAVASLLERDHAHASDELMHLRCYLRFPLAIPSFSHRWPSRRWQPQATSLPCSFLLDERSGTILPHATMAA